MNYSDYFKNNPWFDYMNQQYIDAVGPEVKVFKLDKVRTQIDDLYGESANRFYLPPFSINSIHYTNPFATILDDSMFFEQEQNKIIFVNFNNMVQKVTALKKLKKAEFTIVYTGEGEVKIQKQNNTISIFKNLIETWTIDVTGKTIDEILEELAAEGVFTITLPRYKDFAENLLDFKAVDFTNKTLSLFTYDDTYKNVTDVIEIGDVVLTDKYRLYEIMSAIPAGDTGWKYRMWKLECKLAEVDKVNLPDNYVKIIQNREYGLKHKVNME